jgi:hypothetical protein
MSLQKVMFIRHAEKPNSQAAGIDESGNFDHESLTPRGWQRAGALVRFFYPAQRSDKGRITVPDAIFAAGVGPGSKSKRSVQTVSPLAAFLQTEHSTPFITIYPKDAVDRLVDDVSQRNGTVLVAWEHKLISSIVYRLSAEQLFHQVWPDDRFDLVWILERNGADWTFSQIPQLLLPGDAE